MSTPNYDASGCYEMSRAAVNLSPMQGRPNAN
jgi:hypothetical protein